MIKLIEWLLSLIKGWLGMSEIEITDFEKMEIDKSKKMFNTIGSEMLGMECFKPGFPTWAGIEYKKLPLLAYQEKVDDTDIWVTWCNQGAFYILSELGYDLDAVYATGGNVNTSPYPLAVNCDKASKTASRVIEETVQSAVRWAQFGVPCIAVDGSGFGHVGLFDPSSTLYEPIILQTGSDAVRGKHTLDDSFYKWGMEPKFYRFHKGDGTQSKFQFWFS